MADSSSIVPNLLPWEMQNTNEFDNANCFDLQSVKKNNILLKYLILPKETKPKQQNY